MPLDIMQPAKNWNFSNKDKEGYSEQLIGTVVSIQEVQAREFDIATKMPGKAKVWQDGNPVWNIRMGFAMPDGSLKTFTFAEAGKAQREGKKPSVHVTMCKLAQPNSVMSLIGQTLQITTWPANPTTGQAWGLGNPRLFDVQVVPGIKYELSDPLPAEYTVEKLLADDGASGGQPVQQQSMQQYQGQAPSIATVGATAVAVPMAAGATVQGVGQPVATGINQAAGMDPTIAANMQQATAAPATSAGIVYDDEIPF